jgi:hypothetical protein
MYSNPSKLSLRKFYLGELLLLAGIITPAQLSVVLEDQEFTSYQMRVGEILLSRNWITKQTLNFFLKDVFEIQKRKHLPMGKCLKYAGLLTDRQIQNVLKEQSRCWMKFGEVAVLHNYLRQETLDFFEEYFFSDKETNFPLGTMLQQAGFISEDELDKCLQYQATYSGFRIGEILSRFNFVKKDTVEFFVEDFPRVKESKNMRLGACLKQAGILTDQQIENLLIQQNYHWTKFGRVAVSLGYIKKETLEFFKTYLMPHDQNWADYRIINSPNKVLNLTIRKNASTDNFLISEALGKDGSEETTDAKAASSSPHLLPSIYPVEMKSELMADRGS